MNRGLAAAAAIVVSFALGTALASHEAAAAGRQRAPTCSAVDRDFLRVASSQLLLFRTWSADYVTGADEPTAQAAMADQAARLVLRKHALDESLERARLLIGSMLIEYERAILATTSVAAGASFQRVRDLGIALRTLLSEAGPALGTAGCDVAPLL